jgi:hypothetical protein
MNSDDLVARSQRDRDELLKRYNVKDIPLQWRLILHDMYFAGVSAGIDLHVENTRRWT